MLTRWTAVLLVALAAGSCRRTKTVPMDTSQAKDIPREIALARLQEDLPTAYYAGCTLPSERYRNRHVKEWVVTSKGVEVRPVDEDDVTFTFAYADITGTRLDRRGRSYWYVKLFSAEQAKENTEHFYFAWREEEPAKRVLELFEALRQKN